MDVHRQLTSVLHILSWPPSLPLPSHVQCCIHCVLKESYSVPFPICFPWVLKNGCCISQFMKVMVTAVKEIYRCILLFILFTCGLLPRCFAWFLVDPFWFPICVCNLLVDNAVVTSTSPKFCNNQEIVKSPSFNDLFSKQLVEPNFKWSCQDIEIVQAKSINNSVQLYMCDGCPTNSKYSNTMLPVHRCMYV